MGGMRIIETPDPSPPLDRSRGELTQAEAIAALASARRAEQVEREDEILATLKSTIVSRLAEERTAEREAVLRFLEGYRQGIDDEADDEESHRDATGTLDALTTIIHKIREGNHVTRGVEARDWVEVEVPADGTPKIIAISGPEAIYSALGEIADEAAGELTGARAGYWRAFPFRDASGWGFEPADMVFLGELRPQRGE